MTVWIPKATCQLPLIIRRIEIERERNEGKKISVKIVFDIF